MARTAAELERAYFAAYKQSTEGKTRKVREEAAAKAVYLDGELKLQRELEEANNRAPMLEGDEYEMAESHYTRDV